jgi:very-short-patch-repair endonuclease
VNEFSIIGDVIPAYLKTQAAVWENPSATEKNLSPAEVALCEALGQVGLEPVQQFAVGPYYVDFYFPDVRLAVEVDGAAFHRDWAKEKRRDRFLVEHGVRRVIHMSAGKVLAEPLHAARAVGWYVELGRRESESRQEA